MSSPHREPYDYPDKRGGLDDDRPGDEDQGKTGSALPRPDSPDSDLDAGDK